MNDDTHDTVAVRLRLLPAQGAIVIERECKYNINWKHTLRMTRDVCNSLNMILLILFVYNDSLASLTYAFLCLTLGVPTPSPEILRHTLNMLVRERKIYPTPEGYFIVTPQTYFITPSLIRTNRRLYD